MFLLLLVSITLKIPRDACENLNSQKRQFLNTRMCVHITSYLSAGHRKSEKVTVSTFLLHSITNYLTFWYLGIWKYSERCWRCKRITIMNVGITIMIYEPYKWLYSDYTLVTSREHRTEPITEPTSLLVCLYLTSLAGWKVSHTSDNITDDKTKKYECLKSEYDAEDIVYHGFWYSKLASSFKHKIWDQNYVLLQYGIPV